MKAKKTIYNNDHIPVTRLTGLLGPNHPDDTKSALCSRILHNLLSTICYSVPEMENPFEAFQQELLHSDRESKTIDRYCQIICSYRKWLGDRKPGVETAKHFISWLRENNCRSRSILLYYHVLKIFHDYIGLPFKLKLRKEKTLPPYHDKSDIEAIIAQARKGLRGQMDWHKQRNTAMVLILAYTGMRKSELLNLSVRDVDFNRQIITIVKGKGNKDRTIPIASRIIVPLRT